MNVPTVFRIFLAGVGFIVFPAPAQETPEEKPFVTIDLTEVLTKALDDVFSQTRGAVVRVIGSDRHGRLMGTGFFVDAMGTLLTTHAVVGDAEEVRVIVPPNTRSTPARVLASDPRSGVAVVRVETNASANPFLLSGKSSALAKGTPILSLGYSSERDISRSLGLVENFDRKNNGAFLHTTHIRVVLPVQRGCSGAPLLNFNGKVVGMLVSGADGVCHVLPIEAANKIIADVTRYGEPRPGWVGVTVETSPDGTVIVESTEKDSPAREADIRSGDKLLAVGDRIITAMDDMIDAAFFLSDGDRIALRVVREDKELNILVTVGKRPTPAPHSTATPEFNLLGK